MKTASVIFIALLCVQTATAQWSIRDIDTSVFPPASHSRLLAAAAAPGDLVVGFPNPNEVREISTELLVEGNVIVVNNGRLRINGAALRVQGNVHVLNNGGVELLGGRLEFVQGFLYQRVITVSNTASLWFAGSTLDVGGYNLACSLADSAALRFDASSVASGVLTTSVRGSSRVDAVDSQPLGEMLFFDNTRGSFNGCSTLLSWLALPDGSVTRGRMPGSNVPNVWIFPDSMRSASGFGAQVRYENCVNLAWALMLLQGCDAVFEDSDFLAVGSMHGGTGTSTIAGLVNGVTHNGFVFPATDRSVRFDRTRIGAWNLYALGQHQLTVNNSVFGEILSFENSSVVVNSSICDGSGGYIGSMDDSRMQLVQSSLRAPVIARQRSQLFTVLSNVQGSVAHAAENSVLGLLHSTFTALPTVDSGAVATVLGIDDPSQAPVNSLVPVYGTVRFLPGKDVPISFVSYWLDGIRLEDPDDPFYVSGPSIRQRYRDTLCVWNTAGLLPGDHALRIHMRLSSGDTIVIPWPVSLTTSTAARHPAPPSSLHILGIAPNPVTSAQGAVLVHLDGVPGSEAVLMLVHDVLGRCVLRSVVDSHGPVSISTQGWPRGHYRVTIQQGYRQTAATLVVQ